MVQLAASGEKERLKAELRERLAACGWQEDVSRHARGALCPRRLPLYIRSSLVSGRLRATYEVTIPLTISKLSQHNASRLMCMHTQTDGLQGQQSLRVVKV